ncbi:MAG: ribosome maturation factor RimM [Treponema sp.]|nr:ribosome maturation factor RimM [Treponema sp.]
MTDRFVVGLIGAPFGLKGFVKVRSLSGETGHLLNLQSVILRQGNAEKTIDIEESASVPPQVIMKFAGINSPEAAKSLGGGELIVCREQASPLKPGEFYIEDLRGLAVVAADTAAGGGEIVGHLTNIVEGGGGELAEIRLSTGEFKFVPFRKEFFAPIEPGAGRLILRERWILE